jgi:hypothetical protein
MNSMQRTALRVAAAAERSAGAAVPTREGRLDTCHVVANRRATLV